MAGNKFQIKRTAVTGRAANTSTIDVGELALNITDGIMYSTNGSVVFEIGANLSSLSVAGLSYPTTDGNADQVLVTDGSGNLSFANASSSIAIANSSAFADIGIAEYDYTASTGQTTFTGADDNAQTLGYQANSIEVFLNGVLLDPAVDYTATNGTSIVLTSGAANNDLLQVVAFTAAAQLFQPKKLDTITSVANTAAYTLYYNSVAYTPKSAEGLIVSLNGVTQEPNDSYTVSGSTITFSPALANTDVIDYIVDMQRSITVADIDLDAHNDVTISSVANGQVLMYNSSTSQWENTTHNHATVDDATALAIALG